MKEKPLIKVSQEIYDKIQFLCSKIARVEWSGILLYSVEGTIKDPANMIITLQDIIPMHKGTVGATSYSYNEPKRDTSGYDDKHIDYVMDNPEAMDWKVGHIHSHHTMRVFFSDTDQDEQDDNSPSHNFYLSFIVNNFMEFIAQVSFIIKAESKHTVPYMALDENGEEYQYSSSEFTISKEKLVVMDCEIERPVPEIQVAKNFSDGVFGIIEDSERRKRVAQEKAKKKAESQKKKPVKKSPSKHYNYNAADRFHPPQAQPKEPVTWFDSMTDIEEFAITLLRGTNPPDASVFTIQQALEDISIAYDGKVDGNFLAESLVNNIGAVYEKVFENREDILVSVIEETIEMLEDEEDVYSFISPTIMMFKAFVEKYEENVRDTQPV